MLLALVLHAPGLLALCPCPEPLRRVLYAAAMLGQEVQRMVLCQVPQLVGGACTE